MIGLIGIREKTYAYLMDDDSKHEKGKGTKKCVIKCYKTILKSQQRFKSNCYNVYTEQINKIALSGNDDKRLQTFDKSTTYPYGTNAFKVCESEFRRNSKI